MKTFAIAALAAIAAAPAFAHTQSAFHVHSAETGTMMLVAAIAILGLAIWRMR